MQPSKLLSKITGQLDKVSFQSSSDFHWDPVDKTIWYVEDVLDSRHGQLLLIHEVGHALLGHQEFNSDIDLLKKEVLAWVEARQIAQTCQIGFDEELVEQCLNTYRQWIDKRSTCPECQQTGYQSSGTYHCFNCNHRWRVSNSQTTRVCRLSAMPR